MQKNTGFSIGSFVNAADLKKFDNIENTKRLIEAAIAAICDPSKFKIKITEGEYNVIFSVIGTDKTENAKLIGRKGKVANCLRCLVHIAGRRDGRKYILEIVDSVNSESSNNTQK